MSIVMTFEGQNVLDHVEHPAFPAHMRKLIQVTKTTTWSEDLTPSTETLVEVRLYRDMFTTIVEGDNVFYIPDWIQGFTPKSIKVDDGRCLVCGDSLPYGDDYSVQWDAENITVKVKFNNY